MLVTEENLFGQLAVEHLIRVPQTPGHRVLGERFSVEQWHDGGGGGEIIKSWWTVKRNRRSSVRLRTQLPLVQTRRWRRWSRATTGRPAADRCLGGPLSRSARATSRTVSASTVVYLPARVVLTTTDKVADLRVVLCH